MFLNLNSLVWVKLVLDMLKTFNYMWLLFNITIYLGKLTFVPTSSKPIKEVFALFLRYFTKDPLSVLTWCLLQLDILPNANHLKSVLGASYVISPVHFFFVFC